MFGYITVNKDTLSEENKKIYQSYYCGLCQTMKSQYGRRAQMALNYHDFSHSASDRLV